MEKMNQVSVSEFFAKSKEELYDMAVEMVEKYNRLVDICNDSAERMADLIERHVKKVDELEKEVNKWQDLAKMNRDTICDQYNVCEYFKKKIAELENEIEGRKKTIKLLDEKVERQRENLNALNKTLEIRTKENERLIAVKKNQDKEIEAHESENKRLTERIIELKKERDKHIIDRNATIMQLEKQVKYLEKELNETCTCKELDLKGHQSRETALVNALADKNDEIKKLKESIEEWKNQERIRTNQLRATESKVEELWKEIEKFTKGEEDDYGKSGFKRYIEHLIEEEERAVPERFKERLNEEIETIFTKEEETEVKGVGRTSSGRYPWGAKVNDIPCGEDAIE